MSTIQRPWPFDWEQRPEADDCMHTWETVSVESRPGHVVIVGRCAACHTPRCDRLEDGGQCLDRRHHRTVHIFPSGYFEPVGGLLREEL